MANFTKNYETTEIIENPNVLGGGARPLNTYDLGFGDVEKIHSPSYVGNKPTNLSKEQILANAQLITDGGMCLNSEGKKVGCNTLNQTVVNAPKEVAYSSANLSPEEKFYESLGLKSSMFFTLKAKGRFLVAGVLVAGYFAYKKFKK